jgi:ABC-2 type transport system permease protein
VRKFFILFGREVSCAFRQPLAYVVLFFFLLVTGFNFQAGVTLLNQGDSTTTMVEAFFNTVYFWFPFTLAFPLITMRVFAEEAKSGTIEMLMTAPVRDWQVVLAKYAGCVFFFAVLWAPSAIYFVMFRQIVGIDPGSAVGSYVGAYSMLVLMGMFFVAIGCLASALTDNQIVAAIMTFAAVLFLFFIGLLSFLLPATGSFLREATYYFSPIEHMMDFSRGIFDTRPVVFYLSSTLAVLFALFHAFQYRRWKA